MYVFACQICEIHHVPPPLFLYWRQIFRLGELGQAYVVRLITRQYKYCHDGELSV